MSQQKPRLTSAQRAIVALIRDGYDQEAIAAEMGVAESTIRSHVRKIQRALGESVRMYELPAALDAKECGEEPC